MCLVVNVSAIDPVLTCYTQSKESHNCREPWGNPIVLVFLVFLMLMNAEEHHARQHGEHDDDFVGQRAAVPYGRRQGLPEHGEIGSGASLKKTQ